MQKLQKEFLGNGGEFKEYRIEDLFEKVKTKGLPYKAKDLRGKNDEIYNLPALTAGVENQGLAYFVPRENATILKNVISVSANGANTGVMYYQPNEFTVLQDAYAIKFKGEQPTDKQYLFLVGALTKSIRFRYDWSNKAGWERIKSEKITLPTTAKGGIDFSYMENYIAELEAERIAELEAERIAELEAYLNVTGLSNYTLTKKEKESLIKTERGG